MREQPSDVRIPAHRAREEEVDHGARSFEDELKDWGDVLVHRGRRVVCAGLCMHAGRRGMNKYERIVGVQLRPQWTEGRIAEVSAVVVREEDDAVCVQSVEGVPRFDHGAIDVRERQACEEAEFRGMPALQVGGAGVAGAGEGTSKVVLVRSEVHARRGDAEDGFADREFGHEGEVRGFGPLL